MASSLFENNYAVDFGGCITCRFHCNLTSDNSTFRSNYASIDGGVIDLAKYSAYNSTNSVYIDSKCISDTGVGGAISCQSESVLDITSSLFNNSFANTGSHIYSTDCYTNIDHTDLNNGYSTASGNIYITLTHFTIRNSNVYSNVAAIYGGGIVCQSSYTCLIDSVNFIRNRVNSDLGGALFFNGVTAVIESSYFFNNSAPSAGRYLWPLYRCMFMSYLLM